MATGNMHKNSVKIGRVVFGRTDKQTGGEVIKNDIAYRRNGTA